MSAQSILRQATGLNLSTAAAERAVSSRMARTGAANHDAYLAALTPAELTQLVELVVVPESWLFRDPLAFQAAAEFVRARLADAAAADLGVTRPVRILSLPCAGGEEPYSIAMALSDAGVAHDSFTIDACDISAACVARARSGIFGRNAFRSQDLGFRERYFTQAGEDDFRLVDAIRNKVRFSQGNLLQFDADGKGERYDVIFCRNLLIYFDKPTTGAAIARLDALLHDEGVLFAGYAEVHSFCQHGFTPLTYARAFGLRKDTATVRDVAADSPPATRQVGARRQAVAQAAARATGAPALTPVSAPAPAPPARRPSHVPADTGMPVAASAARVAAANPPPNMAPNMSSNDTGDNVMAQARKLADLGRHTEAASKCRAWLEQTPDAAEAYFILGLLDEHAGDLALAQQHWRRCIYLVPDHYEALCHLALLAERTRDPAAPALKARAARVYQRQHVS